MAQIDPSIALQGRGIQLPNQLAQYSQAQDVAVNAMKMQEYQRGLAQENKLRELIASGADLNSPETIKQMYSISPKMGAEFEKSRATIKKEQTAVDKNIADLEAQYVKNARDTLGAVSDQSTYNVWREQTIARLPGLAQIVPPQYSPQVKMSLMADANKYLDMNTISASQRAQLAQSESQFQRNQAKPVFSPDYGGFIVPPSANAPQGSFVPVTGPTGAPLQSTKPLTEGQAKGVGFALRAAEADKILSTVGADGKVQPGLIKRALESTPFIGEGLGTMANITQSAAQQQVEQAQRNFVNAVLRQESGAVINEDEFNNAKKQYFPQPGDSAEVIKQKADARRTTIRALETQAGPGLARAGAAATATGGGNTVTIPGGKVLTFPTPEAAAAYRQATGL